MVVIIIIVINNINSAPAVNIDQVKFLFNIFTTAIPAVIGALNNIKEPIVRNISTWVMSFVVLVINDDVDISLISWLERDSTCRNNFFLTFLEKLHEIYAIKYPITISHNKHIPAHSIIYPPLVNISLILDPSVCTNLVISAI